MTKRTSQTAVFRLKRLPLCIQAPWPYINTMRCFKRSEIWCLLGIVFQWVVIIIDADAKKQRTQTLHQPFIFSQILWNLRRQLQESVKDSHFIQDVERDVLIHSHILCWVDSKTMWKCNPGIQGSGVKDTKGTFSWLWRKCVTAIGQLLIHVHSSMRRPTLVCTLLPCRAQKNTTLQQMVLWWQQSNTKV